MKAYGIISPAHQVDLSVWWTLWTGGYYTRNFGLLGIAFFCIVERRPRGRFLVVFSAHGNLLFRLLKAYPVDYTIFPQTRHAVMRIGETGKTLDLVREIDVTGLLDWNGRNLLRWVDGTLHGISSDMFDKPNDMPLNEMKLVIKDKR